MVREMNHRRFVRERRRMGEPVADVVALVEATKIGHPNSRDG